jgi:hypothetical protein
VQMAIGLDTGGRVNRSTNKGIWYKVNIKYFKATIKIAPVVANNGSVMSYSIVMN